MTLFWPDRPGDTLTIRGARVIDAAAGIDGAFDVTVEEGVITDLEHATAHEVLAGREKCLYVVPVHGSATVVTELPAEWRQATQVAEVQLARGGRPAPQPADAPA